MNAPETKGSRVLQRSPRVPGSRARLTTYMTLPELAELLGMPKGRSAVQRLRRRLKAKQRRTNSNFLQRLGDGPQARLVVTLADLRHHCPELFDRREETLENIREYVGGLTDSLAELKLRDRALAARIRDHEGRLQSVESCVRERQLASRPPQG